MVLDSPFSSLTKLMGELAQVYPLLPAGASIGPFFLLRCASSPRGPPERRGVAHRHAALGRALLLSGERLLLQSGRVPFKAPPFLVPPMISYSAAVRGRPARELRHRAARTCALFLWRRPCAAPRVHRLARGLGSPRRRLHRQGHRAADTTRQTDLHIHWQVEVVPMLSMPCLFAHASDVRRPPGRPAGSAARPRAAPSGRRFVRGARARPTPGSAQPRAKRPAGLSDVAAGRGACCAARRSVGGAPHSHRLRALPLLAERRTPAVMFGRRMPVGVARAQGDFVGASHSRRLHASCASPRKRFAPLAVRAAATACEWQG